MLLTAFILWQTKCLQCYLNIILINMKFCLLSAAVKSNLCNYIAGGHQNCHFYFFDHFEMQFEDQYLYFEAIHKLCQGIRVRALQHYQRERGGQISFKLGLHKLWMALLQIILILIGWPKSFSQSNKTFIKIWNSFA